MKILKSDERIAFEGVEIVIPKNCYGILSDEYYSILTEGAESLFTEFERPFDENITIVHDPNNPDEYMLRKYMEEELHGEYGYGGAVSVFKIFIRIACGHDPFNVNTKDGINLIDSEISLYTEMETLFEKNILVL